jgi:hypothetical protein
VDLGSLVLAPIRVPLRVARALDDLTVLADRARKEPDPVEEVRVRLDALLMELTALNLVAREIVEGGRDLTDTAKQVDLTGRMIHDGGKDLEAVARGVEARGAEIRDGGADLTQVATRLEIDMRALLSALPKIMSAVDVVEELEGAVETVAETIEPLQGTAERVGRVTQRLSRRRGAS